MVDQYRGLYEAAETDLRRALEIQPQNGDVWRRLGLAYQNNNRFRDAIPAYEKAIQFQPGYFKNYQALCDVLSAQGNYEEAVRQCTEMIALAPDLWESYFARATVYFNWGRFADADADSRLALKLDPSASKAIQLLASSLVIQSRYEEAIPLFQRAIEIGPETDRIYLNLGQTLRWAGLPQQARQAYRKGLALAQAELANNSREVIIQAHSAYLRARRNPGRI